MLDKIVTGNSVINPFHKILYLFLNEAISNDVEWLNKNIDAHYKKLLNTILNILKV